MRNYDCATFDKKQIALTIRNATMEDKLDCSLREEKIINNCDNCSLKSICVGIDHVRDNYVKSASTVVKEFNF